MRGELKTCGSKFDMGLKYGIFCKKVLLFLDMDLLLYIIIVRMLII